MSQGWAQVTAWGAEPLLKEAGSAFQIEKRQRTAAVFGGHSMAEVAGGDGGSLEPARGWSRTMATAGSALRIAVDAPQLLLLPVWLLK